MVSVIYYVEFFIAEFPCTETLQVGNGLSALPRHFYNSLTQQCLPFTYSGIGGNQNNYLSRADCEKACPGISCSVMLTSTSRD